MRKTLSIIAAAAAIGAHAVQFAPVPYVDRAATNALRQAKAYTDAATNGLLRTESDPVFTAWTNGTATLSGAFIQGTGFRNALFSSPILAKGARSHAQGYATRAYGDNSHAEGSHTVASNMNSHAEGESAEALGRGSHAEGYYAVASNDYAHAEGDHTVAGGRASHAGGSYSRAWGDTSRAWGLGAVAAGELSSAMGYMTRANGGYSSARGYWTVADGLAAQAEGLNATAEGSASAEDPGGIRGTYAWSAVYTDENTNSNYRSHGPGTYNINPSDGADGFYIGETNLPGHVRSVIREDGLATTNDTAAISRSVNALWQYTFGDRAWIAVTNYMRTAEGVVPSLQLWEVRDGATNCVYNSGEEIAHAVSNEVNKIALVFSNLLEGVRAQMPTTAWSAYQSMSGAPNPASNEVTVVSTPTVMLTGGAEWQQYVDVSSNSLWVLSSKGVTVAGSDTNGYFRIYDAEGNTAFEVVKEKAMTVDAIPQGITPPGDVGTMSVTFIANAQPTLWLSPTLDPPAFVEASEDTNASVAWTDNGNGTWTAEVDFVNVNPQYFAYATFVKPGTTVVRNTAPMRVDGGIVTSDGTKIKPVVSGSAVSWEVVE